MHVTDSLWLDQFLVVLDASIGQFQLDNEFFAKEMGISKRQFYRKIQTLTGLTPNQYIKVHRLKKAKVLMESGQYQTVQEISLIIGYQNPHYFSKEFEKEYSMTPMDLLKQLGIR